MAATLTSDNELIFASFPVEKMEETKDGDLLVWGKTSDGTVDGDMQIVDPDWSLKALQEWFDTGANVRVQHQAQRDPAGVGVELDGHYLKAKVVEKEAKKLVKAGALGYFSIGISRPEILHGRHPLDPEGKAIGGIITGRKDGTSRIPEVSLVDRGSNFNSKFQLVKAAADGSCEYVGKMVGADDFLAKAASGIVNVDLPEGASVSISPADLARLSTFKQRLAARQAPRAAVPDAGEDALKAIAAAEFLVTKRDIDTATRRRLAKEDRALPDGSYPLETHEDAENAVTLALSGHGDVAAAKKLIRRVARKEGWKDILARLDKAARDKKDKTAPAPEAAKSGDSGDDDNDDGDTMRADDGQYDEMDGGDGADGDGDDGDAGKAAKPGKDGKAAKGGKGGRKLPEAFTAREHHADGDGDGHGDGEDAAKSAKPARCCPQCGKRCKRAARFCGKCGTPMKIGKASRPVPAGHAEGAAEAAIKPAPPHREPDGPAMEMFEADAGLADGDEAEEMRAAREHRDLEDTRKMAASAAALHSRLGVPRDLGWLHDLTCPAFDPDTAKAAHPHADLSMIDVLAWQEKAMDAAANAPRGEGERAGLLWQHAMTVKAMPADLAAELREQAHKAFRDANPGPGRAPVPGEITAARFRRPYLAAGHGAPSPQHEPPNASPLHPGHVSAADFTRDLITAGHAADSPGNATPRPAPVPAPEVPGVPSRVYYTRLQRDGARQAMAAMHDHIAMTFPDLCPMHGPGLMGASADGARPVPAGVGGPVPRGASKADGHARAQARKAKAAAKAARLEKALRKARKAAGITAVPGEAVTLKAAAPAADPEAIRAAVEQATAPLAGALRDGLAAARDQIAAQDKKLRKQAKVLDAIASQPDPAVTGYRGVLPGSPSTSPPAGVPAVAKRAERAQATAFDVMYDTWRHHDNPEERLRAFDFLMKMAGLDLEGKKAD